jgi:hypothetical protein
MGNRNIEERLRKATFSSIVKEMAQPRLAASVRNNLGRNSVTAHARFRTGVLLHNRNTKEDGVVTRVYKFLGTREAMYEVLVSVRLDTWAGGHYVSDWTESVLELSDNAILKSAPPTEPKH